MEETSEEVERGGRVYESRRKGRLMSGCSQGVTVKLPQESWVEDRVC